MTLAIPAAPVALAGMSLPLFANQFKPASLFTLPVDLFPARAVAWVWGMFGAAGSLGVMLFQPAVGLISEKFGFSRVFAVAAFMPLAAAHLVSVLVPRVTPLTPEMFAPAR